MSERFSEEDLLKKGFVRDGAGVFVPAPKGKTPMLDKALDQPNAPIDTLIKIALAKSKKEVKEICKPPAQKLPFNPKEGLFAKGRLKKGVMNKTESTYAQHLNALKFAGEISQWWFEAIKLKLADNTSITVDFAILYTDGRFVFHDAKGHRKIFQDDAKAKMKIAAEMFPFEFFVVFPRRQKDGGGWDIEQINPDKNKNGD